MVDIFFSNFYPSLMANPHAPFVDENASFIFL